MEIMTFDEACWALRRGVALAEQTENHRLAEELSRALEFVENQQERIAIITEDEYEDDPEWPFMDDSEPTDDDVPNTGDELW